MNEYLDVSQINLKTGHTQANYLRRLQSNRSSAVIVCETKRSGFRTLISRITLIISPTTRTNIGLVDDIIKTVLGNHCHVSVEYDSEELLSDARLIKISFRAMESDENN